MPIGNRILCEPRAPTTATGDTAELFAANAEEHIRRLLEERPSDD